MVFRGFHFFHFLTKLVSRGMVLGLIFVSFGDLGGHVFLIFESLGDRLKI